jgi:hypothetical protein
MAEVIWLEHGEQPPADAQWVLVDEDQSRGITGPVDMRLGPPGTSATFFVTAPYREAERADAIEKAKMHADGNRIAKIYVTSRVR